MNMMLDGHSLGYVLKFLGIKPYAFSKLLRGSPSFTALYHQCQSMRAELLVEQIIEIADDKYADPMSVRNRVDARKWYASKMVPHRYGERIDISVSATVDIRGALQAAKDRAAAVRDITPQALEITSGMPQSVTDD